MKNIRIILCENFHFLVLKFSVYLNRHVFVMENQKKNIAHTSLNTLPRKSCADLSLMCVLIRLIFYFKLFQYF